MILEMAYLTTNPSPFIINVPELQNVQTSATGASGIASLSNTVNDILTYINTANSQININTIGSATTGSISFTSNINLSNSVITFLGSNLLGSNLVNGPANFLAFQVNSVERARLTTTGFGIGTASPALNLDVNGSAHISNNLGIGTATPALNLDVNGSARISSNLGIGTASPALNLDVNGSAHISNNLGIGTASPLLPLDVNGSARISNNLGIGTASPLLPLDVQGGAIIRGPLYVSTFGATSSQTGNIIADGNVFANGYFTPSDPLLKRDIISYVSPGLPTPVEFNWRSNGERDIGVLADEIARLEPACVVPSPSGVLNVDYAKLTVLLCAEVRTLKSQMSTMMARLH